MATITFDKVNKLIQLAPTDISTTVQELINNIRPYEANVVNLDITKIIDASGKDNIGSSNTTAITLVLLNGWILDARARVSPTVVTISGGNLITPTGVTPFKPETNVSYDRAASTAPGLVGTIQKDVTDIRDSQMERFKIDKAANQLVIYNVDGTEKRRFSLKDSLGNPSTTEIFERVPV